MTIMTIHAVIAKIVTDHRVGTGITVHRHAVGAMIDAIVGIATGVTGGIMTDATGGIMTDATVGMMIEIAGQISMTAKNILSLNNKCHLHQRDQSRSIKTSLNIDLNRKCHHHQYSQKPLLDMNGKRHHSQ